ALRHVHADRGAYPHLPVEREPADELVRGERSRCRLEEEPECGAVGKSEDHVDQDVEVNDTRTIPRFRSDSAVVLWFTWTPHFQPPRSALGGKSRGNEV